MIDFDEELKRSFKLVLVSFQLVPGSIATTLVCRFRLSPLCKESSVKLGNKQGQKKMEGHSEVTNYGEHVA